MGMLRTTVVVAASLTCSAVALADDWVIRMTVDNQYSAYYGNSMSTTGFVGSDNNWFSMETYNVTGRSSTDYWYVATASDQSVAQGFLGSFTNTTTGNTILTGDRAWEVFRAGDYLQQIFGMSGTWPTNLLPTQPQVDAAIAFATTNNLWTPAVSAPGYTNPGAGPWFAFPAIPSNAMWVWAPNANGGNPLVPGADHGEFLVFRIVGEAVPAPGSAALLALGGLLVSRRRR